MRRFESIVVPVTTVWSSDAPRSGDAPAIADVPDTAGWIASLSDQDRLGLHGRALTQALLGEPVQILSEHGDWAEIVLPWQPSSSDERGYRGWVRRRHIGDAPEASALFAVVTAPVVATRDGLGLSYGTILPIADRADDAVRVGIGDGATAWLDPRGVTAQPFGQRVTDPDAMLGLARQLLGLRYLWGGACGWGLDCSGFVHLTHRIVGLTIPRDAFDQAAACAPRPMDSAGPGDLYFFARPGERVYHVGFTTTPTGAASRGDHTMLHAPETSDAVYIEDAPLAPHRRESLVAAGTFLLS